VCRATRCLSPIVCTPNPSGDHVYCVTDDHIQAALLLSPSSSDIDEDVDFDDDDDDDDEQQQSEAEDESSEILSCIKKIHGRVSERCNQTVKDDDDDDDDKILDEPVTKKMTMSPKKQTLVSPRKQTLPSLSHKVRKSRGQKKIPPAKSSVVSSKTAAIAKSSVTTLKRGRKKSSAVVSGVRHGRSKEEDAEVIDGADALMNLSIFSSSYALPVYPNEQQNERRVKRKVRGTEKQREIDQEKERKRQRALQRELDEEILLIQKTGEEQDRLAELNERKSSKPSIKMKSANLVSDESGKTETLTSKRKHNLKATEKTEKIFKTKQGKAKFSQDIVVAELRKESIVVDKSTRKIRAKKVSPEMETTEKRKSVVDVPTSEARKRKQPQPVRINLKMSKRGVVVADSALDKFVAIANNNNNTVESLEASEQQALAVQGKLIGEILIEIKEEPFVEIKEEVLDE